MFKRIVVGVLAAAWMTVAMAADVKISAEPAMTTLGGTEIFLGNQGGVTGTATAAQQATYARSTITLANGPTQATNTVVGNATSGTAAPSALAVGSCSTSGSALKWTTNTGFGCNTAIDAATLGSATFAAPGTIGGGTPGAASFTNVTVTGTNGGNIPANMFQWGIPVGIPPSGFFANNGVYVVGQAPSSSATLSVSGTSGSITATFSGATLLGTAADVGRVITILDTTYKYCTITAQSSTTVATCTESGGTLSGTGPFTNANLWLSGTPTTNTTAFSIPLPQAFASVYLSIPVNVISASTPAGIYYATCASTTVCTIKNNTLTSGSPTIPGSPTAFATTGTGAFSQTQAQTTLLTFAIPGNSLGTQGSLVIDTFFVRPSNADSISALGKFGGTGAWQLQQASVLWYGVKRTMRNAGATNSQVIFPAGVSATTDDGTSNTAPSYLAIDTTASQNLTVTATLTTSAVDWLFSIGGLIVTNYVP